METAVSKDEGDAEERNKEAKRSMREYKEAKKYRSLS